MSGKAQLLKIQLKEIPIDERNATEWFCWLFTEQPSLKKYFTGAENMSPEACIGSRRFSKTGHKFMISMFNIVDHSDNEKHFQRLVTNVVLQHRDRFKVPINAIILLFQSWVRFIQSKTEMNAEHKAAWEEFYCRFITTAQDCYN